MWIKLLLEFRFSLGLIHSWEAIIRLPRSSARLRLQNVKGHCYPIFDLQAKYVAASVDISHISARGKKCWVSLLSLNRWWSPRAGQSSSPPSSPPHSRSRCSQKFIANSPWCSFLGFNLMPQETKSYIFSLPTCLRVVFPPSHPSLAEHPLACPLK